MRILNVLTAGEVGGIEKLCLDISLKTQNNDYLFVKGFGEIYDLMNKNNIKTYSLFNSKKLNLFKVLSIFIRINKIVKQNNYDAVIFHHGNPILWLNAYLLKKINKKLVVMTYAHSNVKDFYLSTSLIYKKIYYNMLKKINALVAISNDVANGIKELFPKFKNKIFVNYNGIDLSKFYRKKHNFSHPIKIIYVGRLVKEKGVQNILELLSKVDFDFVFSVVGYGNYQHQLEKDVIDLGINTKVCFCGCKTNISKILPNYDIFIHLPDCNEGFGITVLEALASGLICVVNNKGALLEIIKDGFNGFVLEGNFTQQVAKINKICTNFYDNDNILNNALETANYFSIKNTSKNIEEIITKVKDSRGF